MRKITPEEAQAYFKRFELMNEVEIRELRRTPIEVKFRQLAALFAARHMFPPQPDREEQERLVWERWAQLRRALGG